MPPITPLITAVIYLIVIGVALWLINRYVPMAGAIKAILNILVVVVVCLWLLKFFGITIPNMPNIPTH